MNADRWWDVVELPAEILDIDLLSGRGQYTIADEIGVYVVDLRTGDVLQGPL